MWKKILIGLAAVVILFVIIGAFQPATFAVARSTVIAAPPAAVFSQINDYHAWTAWSPWEKLDPAMKRTYEGPKAGTGAIYEWITDDSSVGQGAMGMVESRPNDLIRI